MSEFFRHLFSMDFMPHVYCLRQADVIGVHVASDATIALSYCLIPLALVQLVRQRRDLVFSWMFLLFGAFILSCGLTHGISIWTLWHPAYRFEGLVKAMTAMFSLTTALLLFRLLPQAVALPSPAQLRGEVQERMRAESEVKRLNEELENRVFERTGALKLANSMLAESRRRRTLALEAAGMGTWSWHPEEQILVWDERCAAIFGLEANEPVTFPRFLEAVHPDDRSRVDAAVSTALQDGSSYDIEYCVVWPDGSTHWVRAQGRADSHPATGCQEMHGVAMDISERKQMEAASLRLAAIVESSDDAIFSKSLTGEITSWNKGAEGVFGYTAEEIVGQNTQVLSPVERRGEMAEILDQVRGGVRISSLETVRCRKDGRNVAISLSISPMFDSKGRIVGTSTIARDITSQKLLDQALRSSEERFRTVAETVPDMLFAAAPDGSLTYLSARFQEYTGVAARHSNRDFWAAVLHPEDLPPWLAAWEDSLSTGEQWEKEVLIRRHDGVFRWFVARAIPMRGDSQEISQWLGACTDIDQLKRTENALRYSNDELRQFAYAAAHDLQEPLRNIVNSAELIKQFYIGQLDADADELIKICIEGASRMHGMVKDLLTYTKVLDSPPAETVVNDSGLILQQALANLGAAIAEADARVGYEQLPVVPAQTTHLLQLFQNLIGNALKYRKPGVPPRIKVCATREREHWVFTVSDNGIGFNPAYAEKIFGVFKRLHHRHEYPGNGIGLAICARIVSHYGGRIWAQGEQGIGAAFSFTLPVQESFPWRN